MAITAFPGPPDLAVPYEQMITDGININVNPWTVDNPHPSFGKDPNILNEYGHTEYPMWVDNPDGSLDARGKPNRIIVGSQAEYEQIIKDIEDAKAAAIEAARVAAEKVEADRVAQLAAHQAQLALVQAAPAWPK